ncbi:hypothetical protein NUW58_g85 [Xylaria curta]|uniref:Uncharacterized protein n=1 Tax=Xylaria curta TaxID=42375 RepID=A0ACC1PRM7_9PEZI|nr:hypothetical protein NUW58_g85 [Xylaria curta]
MGSEGVDSWWRPELKSNQYDVFGDAYNDVMYKALVQAWHATPYLNWVKRLSESGWIHLRLLADFMFIGATPQRWGDLDPKRGSDQELPTGDDIERRTAERKRRVAKTKVCVLDYHSEEVKKELFTSAEKLKTSLGSDIPDEVEFRLYVVEDLSRDVIEALGQKFKIEPDFFRAHIVDFAWYNVRDRWRNPPLLDIVSRHQNWMQLRYVTARYFDIDEKGVSSFTKASEEAASFNILRRVDDDLSNKSYWDKEGAIVGLTRSRATFWLQPEKDKHSRVGILLLDPTVTKGVPLWRGHRTLWSTPKHGQEVPSRPPDIDNSFENFIFWAQQTGLYPNCTVDHPSKTIVPLQVLMHFVCSEWLTMSDYIKTRLNQLDWEIVKPKFFGLGKKGVDNMLEKLHMWRRLVPLYREMVSETIRHIDQFSDRIQKNPTTLCGSSDEGQHQSLNHYKLDLSHVKSQLEEYQNRIDQITSVVTAVISIDNSRRSLQDNRNIGRLTWLATFFIPLSLIAGILSMQSDVGEISSHTFTVYFATSIPLIVVIAVAALTLSLSRSLAQNLASVKRLLWSPWIRQKSD